MGYHRDFGMRSFENTVRNARFRAPSTGNPIIIGAPVSIDGANPGRFKRAAEAEAPGPRCGIAIYEHIQNKSDNLVTYLDAPYDRVPLGQYAQILHGVGVKVWFKNSADKALYDGRTQTGHRMVTTGAVDTAADLTTIAPGDGLVPDGNGFWRRTDGTGTVDVGGTAWLVVEQVNPAAGLVEARFTF